MSATTIMIITFGILILEHWAYNEKTIDAKTLVEILFAIVVIALLDHGKTEVIAKGFAWLFLAAVLLNSHSILNVLGKVKSGTGAPLVNAAGQPWGTIPAAAGPVTYPTPAQAAAQGQVVPAGTTPLGTIQGHLNTTNPSQLIG